MTETGWDVDTVRARCFVEVVERGTVAAAARSLGYTAPAVSQQIAKLERTVGVPLFDRMSGRLRPTPAGTALVPHVYAALDALEAGARSARSAAAGSTEAVRIAAFPSALVNLVAPLARRPDVALGVLVEAEDDEGLRELSLGHVEVAIVQEHNHQRYDRDPRLVHHRLLRDPLDLVVPLGWDQPSTLAATGDLPWVVSGAGSPCRVSAQEAWRRAGIEPVVAGEATELATLVALVAAGAGVALLPRLGLPSGNRAVQVVPGASPIVRTVYAVTRRTHSRGAVGRVVAALRSVGREVTAREQARWQTT